MPRSHNCSNCLFAEDPPDKAGKPLELLSCHRHPPMQIDISEIKSDHPILSTSYLMVTEKDWCGEWRRRRLP